VGTPEFDDGEMAVDRVLLAGELDGLELLRRVREERDDEIPFVFVSDTTDTAVIDDAIDLGADRCLPRTEESAAWYRMLAEAVVSTVENHRTRARLERTTDDLRQIYDTVPVMITRKDTENRLLRVNDAVTEYLGRPREEIEGKTAWELFPEQGDEFYEMDRRVLDSGEAIRGEVGRLSTPSGRERWMKTDAIPYRNAEGETAGVLVVSEDITELKSRERELARQNERLERFTSVVSHDLLNPLNVATGRLELAREECDSDHLAAVETAHERMATLIHNLLRLAREGEPVSERTTIDLFRLVDTCWATVETGDAELRNEASRRIKGDESRLRQVFENLFRNSVEHGGTGVTVTVGDSDAGIYVEDDGAGIPVDEREVVFETGYSGSAEGTGFGLSIVAEIVEAHGWTIRVTDGAGGGARFEITGVEFVGAP
jgi:PAS domain S-box-containing protein